MGKWIIGILLFLPASWTKTSRLNKAIDTAALSYAEARYSDAITDHLVLINEFEVKSQALNVNLGLSHQFGEKTEEATTWYDQATQGSDKIINSMAFNQSGVLLGDKKEYQAALSKFQSALIQDPTNEVARYNYELLARWLQRDEERKQQEQNKPEPSEFAKRKKAEADRLVEQFRFRDALKVMEDAKSQDQTVAAYEDYINSLKEVIEIDEN